MINNEEHQGTGYLGFVRNELFAQDKNGFQRAVLKLILKHEKLGSLSGTFSTVFAQPPNVFGILDLLNSHV